MSVVDALKLRLLPKGGDQLLTALIDELKHYTSDVEAYNLYLQGRYYMNQSTEEGLRESVEFFEKVITEDPHCAEAYSGLSDAYVLLGHNGGLVPADVWTKAASNAAWAVLQDEHSVEARLCASNTT